MEETIDQMIARIDAWLDTPIDELFPMPEWMKKPPSWVRVSNKRAALLRLNGGVHTLAEWKALCARYGYQCLRCGRKKPLTKDHVLPVSLGGMDDITNLQPLCRPCNSRKGTQIIDYRPGYESRAEAAKALGISPQAVSKRANKPKG